MITHTFLRRIIIPAPAILAIAILSACGSRGGDNTPAVTAANPVPSGTFIKSTTIVGDAGTSNPFTIGDYNQVQQLYQSDAISAEGYISKVGFRRHGEQLEDVTCPNVTIKLGHTAQPELTNNAFDNVENGSGSHVTVLDNDSVTIPAGIDGEYFDIELTTPFYYNGRDNLVVEVVRTAACSGIVKTKYNIQNWQAFSATIYSDVGTGALQNIVRQARFEFSGGDTHVEPSAGASTTYVPFSSNAALHRLQILYTSDEIAGSGAIAGLALVNNTTTSQETYTVDIALGHSSLGALGESFEENFNGAAPVVVASNLDFVVPAGLPAGSKIWLPLTGIFNYNGTDNLVIDIKVKNAPATGLAWRGAPIDTARRLYGPLDSPLGTTANWAHHIDLRFHGGKAGVQRTIGTQLDWTNVAIDYPLLQPDAIRQYLYRSVELGGAGKITSLACRIGGIDIGETLGVTYNIQMSHTTETTLVATLDDNLVAPTTVFSGTMDVPAIKQGDWHKIALTTPFSYNGKDNLVVEISGTSPGNISGCIVDATVSNETLNFGRMAGVNDSAGTIGSILNYLPDMLFDIQR